MSITVARDVTEAVKPPRALFAPFRMGHHFGVPFHVELQRRIIREALALLEITPDEPLIVDLDVTWAQARKEGKAIDDARSH